MNSENPETTRNFLDRIWHPTQEDVVGFRVFQMISVPIIMVLSIVSGIFSGSITWFLLGMAWLIIAILLWVVASIRFKINNPVNNENLS